MAAHNDDMWFSGYRGALVCKERDPVDQLLPGVFFTVPQVHHNDEEWCRGRDGFLQQGCMAGIVLLLTSKVIESHLSILSTGKLASSNSSRLLFHIRY